jgi:hypothetical protein
MFFHGTHHVIQFRASTPTPHSLQELPLTLLSGQKVLCKSPGSAWTSAFQYFREHEKPDRVAQRMVVLGAALGQVGRTREAMEQWEQALRIKPDGTDAHYNLELPPVAFRSTSV